MALAEDVGLPQKPGLAGTPVIEGAVIAIGTKIPVDYNRAP